MYTSCSVTRLRVEMIIVMLMLAFFRRMARYADELPFVMVCEKVTEFINLTF